MIRNVTVISFQVTLNPNAHAKDAGDPQLRFLLLCFGLLAFVMPVKARLGILLALLKRGHWPSGMGDGGAGDL